MKKLFTLFVIIALTKSVFAQSPQKMSYQAIIRNSSDQLVKTSPIGMRISILRDATPVYVETQTQSTNNNGLVSIEVGGGTPVTGTFAGIDWSSGTYFIKTETDPSGGTSYSITGAGQLLSVPYALFAKRAGEHYVGELYGGGVVFWIDQTGQHGLVCSMIDLSTSQQWSNISSTLIGITAQSDWDGLSNSNAILNQSGHTSSAAKLCLDYSNADYGTGIYGDWYLPSRGELVILWNNLYQVQKALESDGNVSTTAISKSGYWSSSEEEDYFAFRFWFRGGVFSESIDASKGSLNSIRAIRTF